jgi:hypothetical protein
VSAESTPAGEEAIKAIPAELQRGLYLVSVSEHAEHIKAALREVADGVSVTNAAAHHACDAEHLRQLAHRYELAAPKRILRGHTRVAALGIEEIERRLLDPEHVAEMSDQALGVVTGISTDKLLAFEKLKLEREKLKAQTSGHDLNAILGEMTAQLQAGERVKLELTIEKQRDAIEIDITEAETT